MVVPPFSDYGFRLLIERINALPIAAALLLAALLCLLPMRAGAAEPLKLMAFGDSLTHGYGLSTGDTFPEQLEAALTAEGYSVRVLNSGNSGDTTAAGLARVDWALADEPDLAIVELGANDALRGLDPAATYENLDAILARFSDAGVAVLLAGMLAPRNLGADYAAEFDSVFPRLAEKHSVPLYPFFLEGVAMDPALNQRDAIHPNAEGVAVIVERILPHVVRLIDSHVQNQAAANE